MNTSDPERRQFRYDELKGHLRQKKYPEGVINSAIQRASALDRTAILNAPPSTNDDSAGNSSNIPFVFTHNNANPNVLNTVRRSLDILAPSERMSRVMKDKKIIAARRQPRNIRSLLFKPRFEMNKQTTKGNVLACRNDPNRNKLRGRPCKCCDYLQECTHLTFKGTDEPFEIRYNFTCDTRNVIYALTCSGCGENYIGKTEREVRDRCGEYRLAIERKKSTQGVHEHISKCSNGKFVMTPFFKLHDSNRDSQMILSYESLFIKRYKPQLNVLKL